MHTPLLSVAGYLHTDNAKRLLDKRPDMITLTKTRALELQAEQVDHYAKRYGERVREIVAAATTAEALEGDGPFSVIEINRHIPRGGFIEVLIERAGLGKTQMSALHD